MKISGSRTIIECLREQEVNTVFGYPGGAILPLYDALHDAPVRHILTVHEQGSVHAADGYARASGRVGVCIATSGPGATNLVTGLATAFMDSSPIVAITGQVGTPFIGRDAFQGVDVTGITMPITKYNYLVSDVNHLADTVREAFDVARSGRPGPVLIDVPRDVLTAETDFIRQNHIPGITAESNHSGAVIDSTALSDAVTMLNSAERPVMIVGGGAKAGQAHLEAMALADATGLPVVSTLMGLGVFPTSHPSFLGMTGMHGHTAANRTVANADLIIAVGSRFSDRITGDRNIYASGKKIIHLDVDSAEAGKNINADVILIGSLRTILSNLTALLAKNRRKDISSWLTRVESWRNIERPALDDASLTPRWMMRHMSEATNARDVTWVTDVGQHQMWAAQHLALHQPRSWITSGGMGTMGFGLPAALGAQVACPDRKIVAICGDGGFKMTGMELYTAVAANVPLTCVIVNNHTLGMVRQLQDVFCESRYTAVDLPPFDFVGFARVCGVRSYAAATPAEFASAFARSLDHAGPSVVVADIPASCRVEPMVTPGQPVDHFIDFNQTKEEVA